MTTNPTPLPPEGECERSCVIFVNNKPHDIVRYYVEKHGISLPAHPSLSVIELAYLGGLAGYNPTYRKDGSVITDGPDFCVAECGEAGHWVEPVWTVNKNGTRAIPLHHGQRFETFPEGYY